MNHIFQKVRPYFKTLFQDLSDGTLTLSKIKQQVIENWKSTKILNDKFFLAPCNVSPYQWDSLYKVAGVKNGFLIFKVSLCNGGASTLYNLMVSEMWKEAYMIWMLNGSRTLRFSHYCTESAFGNFLQYIYIRTISSKHMLSVLQNWSKLVLWEV